MAPNTKLSTRIGNLQREVSTGKTRSLNPRDFTGEEMAQRKTSLEDALAQQKMLREGRRQKTIGPINAHTTLESNLNKAHTTTEANRIIREVSSIVGHASSATPAAPAMDQDMGTMAEDTRGWIARVSQPGGAR